MELILTLDGITGVAPGCDLIGGLEYGIGVSSECLPACNLHDGGEEVLLLPGLVSRQGAGEVTHGVIGVHVGQVELGGCGSVLNSGGSPGGGGTLNETSIGSLKTEDWACVVGGLTIVGLGIVAVTGCWPLPNTGGQHVRVSGILDECTRLRLGIATGSVCGGVNLSEDLEQP